MNMMKLAISSSICKQDDDGILSFLHIGYWIKSVLRSNLKPIQENWYLIRDRSSRPNPVFSYFVSKQVNTMCTLPCLLLIMGTFFFIAIVAGTVVGLRSCVGGHPQHYPMNKYGSCCPPSRHYLKRGWGLVPRVAICTGEGLSMDPFASWTSRNSLLSCKELGLQILRTWFTWTSTMS
jgi:hypothetical protein